MALSKKKQEAINRVYDMEAKVAEYRGITDYRFSWKDYRKSTIRALENYAKAMEEMLTQPLEYCTDKQWSFLMILLSKDYNSGTKASFDAAVKAGKKLTKHQASELINALKTADDYIYGRYPNICQRDFEELDEKMEKIIAMMK